MTADVTAPSAEEEPLPIRRRHRRRHFDTGARVVVLVGAVAVMLAGAWLLVPYRATTDYTDPVDNQNKAWHSSCASAAQVLGHGKPNVSALYPRVLATSPQLTNVDDARVRASIDQIAGACRRDAEGRLRSALAVGAVAVVGTLLGVALLR